MKLLFVRHGEAAGASFAGSDAERPLTTKGRQQAQALALFLASRGVRCDRLFSSPLLRAQQTAEALVAAGVAVQAEECPHLLPEKGSGSLRQFIGSLPGPGTYAFVGHEPLLSEVAESLLLRAPHGVLALGKGAVAWLEQVEGAWRLKGLMESSWLLEERGESPAK
ncbi:MAG: phosphohistidine phosphatase SixA [Thermoanaerobaculum sp.]|nr:phosphohistidine phosphatase SixA [Thermoanaerobaculum sp.]MDW7968034.1 phosphohistidine phosphatase SixA [Thermoanaerobaculum sp.]